MHHRDDALRTTILILLAATNRRPPQGGHGHLAGQASITLKYLRMSRDRRNTVEHSRTARYGQTDSLRAWRGANHERWCNDPQVAGHCASSGPHARRHRAGAGRGSRRWHDERRATRCTDAEGSAGVYRGGCELADHHEGLPSGMSAGECLLQLCGDYTSCICSTKALDRIKAIQVTVDKKDPE